MNDSPDAILRPAHAESALAPYEGLDTEHILIEDEFSSGDAQPTRISQRQIIRNRVGGLVTELTLYQEGFVRIRQGNERRALRNHLIETRFLDPEFATGWHFAKPWLWTWLSLASAGLLAWLLLPLLDLGAHRLWVIIAAAGLSALAGYRFLRRTQETHVFRTARGRAAVLTLNANLGCLRKTRKAARAVSRAIAGIRPETSSGDLRELRAEMRAHYRLLENGVITKDACSEGTAQILAKFG